jgi:hypothetical protein
VSDALRSELDSVEVLQNEIPLAWKNYNQFKGRLADIQAGKVKITPYIGAFEVWHEDFLLFSKLSSRVWPNCKPIAAKVKAFLEEKRNKSSDLNKFSIKYTHPSTKSTNN